MLSPQKKSERVNIPTISPTETSQDLTTGISVTLSCSTDEAEIYYTTDGSEPSESDTKYSDTISISGIGDGESVTVKAIAVKDGMDDSEVATITYTNNHVTA